MSVTRKIAIAQQISELEREAALRRNVYPTFVANRRMRQADANEHMARLEGAIATLKWCQEHEHEIRAWHAARHPDALDQALGNTGGDQ